MIVKGAYACPVDGYGFPTCMGDGSACSPDLTRCSGMAPVPVAEHETSVTTRRHPNGWMNGLAVASCRCGWSRIVMYGYPDEADTATSEADKQAHDHLANSKGS